MSSFTTPLIYRRIATSGPRARFRLKRPFTYALKTEDSGVSITVPKGFRTDLASIPRLIDDWFGLNPSGELAKAAVLHDYLYANSDAAWELARDVLDGRAVLGHIYVEQLVGPLPTAVPELVKLARDPDFQRLLADRVFREAVGVPSRSGCAGRRQRLIQSLAYWGVRRFGGRAWARNHGVPQ